MPDPTVAIALVLLVALVESSPAVRLPVGLLLAVALLAADAELLPIAVLGAIGVVVARLSLALAARSGRDRLRSPSPTVQAQREALRAHLARSPAYARTTFVLAALPGVPAGFVFPLLGAMRAPLLPALAGTLAGRVPVLAVTAAIFTWLGRLVSGDDAEAALVLGVLAIVMFVVRTIGRVDWQHRAETGEWRMQPDDTFLRVTTAMGGRPGDAGAGARSFDGHPRSRDDLDGDDGDVVEGELLGMDVEDDVDEDDEPPPSSLPHGS